MTWLSPKAKASDEWEKFLVNFCLLLLFHSVHISRVINAVLLFVRDSAELLSRCHSRFFLSRYAECNINIAKKYDIVTIIFR